ncbi:MAG: hypothetical protein ACKPKO_48330, partial [Candidatus Fonsibacter sp.]
MGERADVQAMSSSSKASPPVLTGFAYTLRNMWHNSSSCSGHTQTPPRQASPVFPWPSPQYPHNSTSPSPPPPPTNTMVPTYPIYTPPRTRESSVVDLTRDDPEEQPRSFNPMRTSIQAFPQAASSSLLDGS